MSMGKALRSEAKTNLKKYEEALSHAGPAMEGYELLADRGQLSASLYEKWLGIVDYLEGLGQKAGVDTNYLFEYKSNILAKGRKLTKPEREGDKYAVL